MANLPIIHEEVRNPEYLTHGPWNNWCCGLADCPCAQAFWNELPTYEQASEPVPIDYDELEQSGTHPPECRCAWCEPQDRNATTQCSDGSWW